jgi:hypothetical protein
MEYKNPLTLEEEATYYLMEEKENGLSVYSRVIFLSYSPTPEVVYVRNTSGHTLHVLREELFEKSA